MSSTILPMILLCAHITGLISEPLLNATVGGSVLIPCSLPGYPLRLKWFYLQEESRNLLFHWHDGEKKIELSKNYEDRCQVFNSEFISGNISIRIHNISLEDDQKTFFALVKLDSKPSQQHCRSTLQVSAPYQDLVLTVDNTANSATCTARGGYPEAQVSWKGLNRSNDEQLDLQGAETSLQQDPTEKTFSFSSSVNVLRLKSVTCVVYNPHSQETITRNMEISAAAGDGNETLAAIIVPVVLVILVLAGVTGVLAGVYVRYRRRRPDPDPDPAQVQAQAQAQDQAEGNGSEERVSLIGTFHRPTTRSFSTAGHDTNEDAAAAPEENGNEDSNSERVRSIYDNIDPWYGKTEAACSGKFTEVSVRTADRHSECFQFKFPETVNTTTQ